MHLSSLANMKQFVETHLRSKANEELVIVDLGSQDIGGSYRKFFDGENWRYLGMDVVAGPNVDIVLDDPYSWGEIKSDSVDVLVSGQTFEHIEFFWITAREIARVLKPGGICCLIAPSGGYEHRYPVDCWRFYPDGLRALARYADLEVISAETHWDAQGYADDSALWADSVLVAQKPLHNRIEDCSSVVTSTVDHVNEHIYDGGFDPEVDSALARIARFIAPGSRVLELGPATGYFTEYLTYSLKCTVDCVEYSQVMADRAQKFCRKMLVADLNEVSLEEQFDIESYDFVIAADVLEHLRNPLAVLKSCRKILKPQGKILLSVPNVAHSAVVGGLLRGEFNYTDEGLLDRTHVHFFTQRSLMDVLREARLSVEHLDAIVKLPEETEIRDDFVDLPEGVQQALYALPGSTAYQYILMASPESFCPSVSLKMNKLSAEIFLERRQSFSQKMTAKNHDLEKGLAHVEAVLKGCRQALDKATAQVKALTIGMEQAERLAFERMTEVKALTVGMEQAERLAFERMTEVDVLNQTLSAAQEYAREKAVEIAARDVENAELSSRLNAIENSKPYKLYKFSKKLIQLK